MTRITDLLLHGKPLPQTLAGAVLLALGAWLLVSFVSNGLQDIAGQPPVIPLAIAGLLLVMGGIALVRGIKGLIGGDRTS